MFKYKRVMAFIFDCLLVSIIVMLLVSNPKINKNIEYQDEYIKSYQTLSEEVLGDVVDLQDPSVIYNKYKEKLKYPTYDLFRVQVYNYVIFVAIVFLYFVIFTYFNDGKTLGCAIFKLKITKKNGDKVGFINLCMRSLFMGLTYIYLVPITAIAYIVIPHVLSVDAAFLPLLMITSTSILIEIVFIAYFFLSKKNMTIQDYLSNTKMIDTKKRI